MLRRLVTCYLARVSLTFIRRSAAAAFAAVLVAAGTALPSSGVSSAPLPVELPQPQPLVEALNVTATSTTPTTAYCRSAWGITCYTPAQLRQAYDVNPLYRSGHNGRGRTIAIVDSFGSPSIQRDLATFDRAYGIPAPPSLKIITPVGRPPKWNPNDSEMTGWATETSLDVEWAHAIAPGARILLVETPDAETEGTAGFPSIVRAETFVLDHRLADVISQSFGATEAGFASASQITSLRGAYVLAQKDDVTVLAGAGDEGATGFVDPAGTKLSSKPTVGWPASDPLVTAVGGTRLSLNAAGNRTAPDTVWNDGDPTGSDPSATGGGTSSVFPRPAFQNTVAGVVGDHRGIPDISLNAAAGSAVPIYTSMPGTAPGWLPVNGTSEATPLFAGIVAIADQVAGTRLGDLNPLLYAIGARTSAIPDITKGDNTVAFTVGRRRHTVTGYRAKAGYDLASGLGTVDAAKLVPLLVH